MIEIGTTGWTIDKTYWEGKGVYNFVIGPSVIWDIVSNVAPDIDYSVTELMRKDSLDMTEEDRLKIAQFVRNSKNKLILITHGTDTMIETAKTISSIIWKDSDRIVVLLWALHPYSQKNSDAEFNVGFWLWVIQAYNQSGSSGIYLCMNGDIFSHDTVKKYDDGVFREIKKD